MTPPSMDPARGGTEPRPPEATALGAGLMTPPSMDPWPARLGRSLALPTRLRWARVS